MLPIGPILFLAVVAAIAVAWHKINVWRKERNADRRALQREAANHE